MTRKFWIGVASKEHVDNGIKLRICQFCHGKSAPARRLSKGDIVIYYSSKNQMHSPDLCQQFTAIGVVQDDEAYQVEMFPGFMPFRRNIKYFNAEPQDIKPLIPSLPFIKNKNSWGYVFRYGFLEIDKISFEIIAKAMLGDMFSKIIDTDSNNNILKMAYLDSPLGPVLAISDEDGLYLLEFVERKGLEKEIERLKLKSTIIPGRTNIIDSIEKELANYFAGNLKNFKTPIHMLGSPFQKMAWQELINIPYGETKSYLAQANAIAKPTAFRAVANANGANQLAIIIPCHRIINSNGELGGYGGGIERKKWLINMEKQFK